MSSLVPVHYSCHTCGENGHISAACKSKPVNGKVHNIEEPDSPQSLGPDSSVDPISYSLHSMSTTKRNIDTPVNI